jgi:PD-(D/E)XK endonuclease
MEKPNHFTTFKARGEWVELRFMTAALEHGYHVSKPWGDSGSYDVGVQHGTDILRVQVKSTTVRTGTGYFCQFKLEASTRRLSRVPKSRAKSRDLPSENRTTPSSK